MAAKRHRSEEVKRKFLQAKEALAGGATVAEVCQKLHISKQTYYRWRSHYGNDESAKCLPVGKRTRKLQSENDQLKRLVADLMLKIHSLEEVEDRCGRC